MHFNQFNEKFFLLLFLFLFLCILLHALACSINLSFHKKLIKHICFTQFPLHFLCIKNLLPKSPLINYCLKMNEHEKKCISKYTRQPTDPKNSHKINLKTYWTSTEGKQRKQTFLFFSFHFVFASFFLSNWTKSLEFFISIANKKKKKNIRKENVWKIY